MGQQQATRVNARTAGGPRQGSAPAAKQASPQINNAVGQLGSGIQNLQGANLQGVHNAANMAQNVNVAPMQQTAQGLQGFNPIQGPAAGTLQNIIATGNPVNVDPITQAAQQQAQLTFGNLKPQINEQFGALGLGSSSAREAELGRQAGQIATGVGIEGLRAGVGAQENAAQRQLAGFNPLLQGTGQQLAGQQAAGQLQGQASGLELQGAGTAGQLRLGAAGEENQFNLGRVNAGQNFVNPLMSAQNQQMNMPPAPGGGGAPPMVLPSGMTKGRVSGYAQGGRVDYGDYLSDMLFGQQFTRRGPEQQAQRPMRQLAPKDPHAGLKSQMMREQLKQMQMPRGSDRQARLQASGAAQKLAQGLQSGPRAYLGDAGGLMSLANTIGAIGVPAAHAGLMQSGSLLGQRSVDARGEAAVQGANAQGAQQRQTYDYLLNRGLNPLTGVGYREGGEVDGPSVPPDVVPIMAQGGELVVPVDLRHQIEMSNSTDPIVQALKGLIDRPVDPSGMAGGGDVSNFLAQDARRRGGASGPHEAIRDRELEGRLMASLMGPLAPMATLPVALAGAGYEGVKGLGQATGLGEHLPGPFKTDESTSPASMANIVALLKGFSERSTGQVEKKQSGGPVMRRGQIDLNAPSFGEQLRSGSGQLTLPQAFQQSFAPQMAQQAPAPQMTQAPQGFDAGQRSFTDRDLQGGFSVMGAEPDPLADLEQEVQHANNRVSLLSSLALRAPAAARMKLSGLIQSAAGERDAAAARFDVMKRTQMMQQAAQQQQQMADQASMQRLETEQAGVTSREQARTEREMEANQLRTEAELFAKGGAGSDIKPGFDPRGAQQAVESFRSFQTGQGTPPMADISQLASMPGAQLPQVLQSIDFASVPQTPETVASAQQILRNLAATMSPQDIRAQYPALLGFLGLQ